MTRCMYDSLRRSGPFRSRKGIFFGVCRGLADYFNFSAFWLRVLTIVLTIATGFWAGAIVYVIAALIMKPEPVLPLESEADAEFYNSYASSRSMALHRLKRTFDSLERRIQRMENIVTQPSYDWDRRLNEGR